MVHNPTYKPISDEMLMRFADGDLGGEERSWVAAEIARDPDLATRFEAFRFTREDLAAIYAPALNVPRQLMGRVLEGRAGHGSLNGATGTIMTSVAKRLYLRRQYFALAAASAVLLVGAAGWLLRDGLRPDYAGLVAPPSLQRALEETPSRQWVTLVGDSSIRVKATFVSRDQRWCREYQMHRAHRAQGSAVACRGTDGVWRVEVEEALRDAAPPANPRAYEPAGQRGAQHGNETGAVDDYRDRIMDADVSLEDELKLIKEHWRH